MEGKDVKMSEFLVKSKHFITKHIWFEFSAPPKYGGGVYDKLIIHGHPTEEDKIGRFLCKAIPQETLISDLTFSEDELWSLTTKTVRNEINRSKREEVKVSVYHGKEVSDELLEEFNKMYHKMYEQKGMQGHWLSINELKEYASKDALVITTAEIDGKTVVYHSYIKDEVHSRFLHSCSEFREADNAARNAIGRANKYLHWNDWITLKHLGVKEYDWGGIASYEEPNGIDKFKMSFGGQYRKYYNLYCDCSFAARAYAKVRKIMRHH